MFPKSLLASAFSIYHLKTWSYLGNQVFSFALCDPDRLFYEAAAAADNRYDLLIQLNHSDTTSCEPSSSSCSSTLAVLMLATQPPLPSSYYHPQEECQDSGCSRHRRGGGGKSGWGRPGAPSSFLSYTRVCPATHPVTHLLLALCFIQSQGDEGQEKAHDS